MFESTSLTLSWFRILVFWKLGNNKIAILLIRNGANVKLCDDKGRSMLQRSVQKGNWLFPIGFTFDIYKLSTLLGNDKIVHFLLKNGADINHADNFGRTPLQAAIDKGNQKSLNIVSKCCNEKEICCFNRSW